MLLATEMKTLDREELNNTIVWLKSQRGSMPEKYFLLLVAGLELVNSLDAKAAKFRGLLRTLRKAMGIEASSEKTKRSGSPIDKKRELSDEIARLKKSGNWHTVQGRKRMREAKEKQKLLDAMNAEQVAAANEAEEFLDKDSQEFALSHETHLAKGDGAQDEFSQPAESLMVGHEHQLYEIEHDANISPVDKPFGAKPIGKPFYETRERFNLSIRVERHTISVEKQSFRRLNGETILVSGDARQYGPPKTKITWEFLSNLTIMAGMYALPFNRFGLLASSEDQEFSSSSISRHFRYVADRFLQVYVELGKSLANAEVIAGDDTSNRVLEVKRELEKTKSSPGHQPVWRAFADEARATELLERLQSNTATEKDIAISKNRMLTIKTAAEFGLVSAKRVKPYDAKEKLQTTVISGKADQKDSRSTIIHYYSHFGGFANLCEQILQNRRLTNKNKELVIQSDLATTNFITDENLRKRIDIKIAGCASHARRPFAFARDDDPDVEGVVDIFAGLYMFEESLNAVGRNDENVLSVRRNDAKPTWSLLRTECFKLAQRYSREHPIGAAARYVEKHFGELTYYLEDPRVALSNDFSERMIRMEKLIEDGSMFRQTLEGRRALDIVRTVLQTAVAAQVDVQKYLEWVLRSPPQSVDEHPERYTPYAFAKANEPDP